MSWIKGKIYICAICDRKDYERVLWTSQGDFKQPPMGWKGDFSKHGTCICNECAKALKELTNK